MAHKDIRITFELDGRRYEAAGFLNEGESSVDGDTMLSRTSGENGGVIGDDDEEFLSEHRSKFPKELRKYYLVTGRRRPVDPWSVSCFCWYIRGWFQGWGILGGQWYGSVLVLRRCA